MIDIQIDTANLNRAIRELVMESRGDLEKETRKQAAIIVGQLIAATPPADAKGAAMNDDGGITIAAKKQGEARIAADIASLFPVTNRKKEIAMAMSANGFQWGTGRGRKIITQFAETEAEMERIHRASRSQSTGRVRTGSTGQNMALTRSAVRRAFIKSKQKQVGRLSAGWLNAARELRTAKRSTPAWITRHGSQPGGADESRTIGGIVVRVFNSMPYFPGDMSKRVQRAVFRRERAMKKAVQAVIARRVAKANARMGR